MWMIGLFDLFVLPEKYNTRCTLDLPCSIAVRIIVSLLKITTFPEHPDHQNVHEHVKLHKTDGLFKLIFTR